MRKTDLILDGCYVALFSPVDRCGQICEGGGQEGGARCPGGGIETDSEQQLPELGVGEIAVDVHSEAVGVFAQIGFIVVFANPPHVLLPHNPAAKVLGFIRIENSWKVSYKFLVRCSFRASHGAPNSVGDRIP